MAQTEYEVKVVEDSGKIDRHYVHADNAWEAKSKVRNLLSRQGIHIHKIPRVRAAQ